MGAAHMPLVWTSIDERPGGTSSSAENTRP